MSDGDICSDNEKYGGFGAAMANSLAADSAASARAVAAVAVAHAPGTKKSLPVPVVERIWKTKGRSKRPKKPNVPAHVLQAAAPAPVPLVAVDQAAACAPVEMKPPPRPSCCAHCGACAHPSEWYCRRDRRDRDELPGPLLRGARDLWRGVEGGRCGAPP